MRENLVLLLSFVAIALGLAIITMGVTFVVGFLLYLFESFWGVFILVFLLWFIACFAGGVFLSKMKR